jgi:hypothetical protein
MSGIDVFHSYLKAYNEKDLAGVLHHLHADCRVVVVDDEGKAIVALDSAAAMRPSYEGCFAFAGDHRVPIVTGPVEIADGDNKHVRVTLFNPVDGKTLDVTYKINADGIMFEHLIHSVK